MKERPGHFGYYKFSAVFEDLIKQTTEVAIQLKRHRAVIDDLYEERKWLVAAYKDEAVSNVRIENAYAELQQRLLLLEQIHKPRYGLPTHAMQIESGIELAVAVLTLVALLSLGIVSCFAIMQMALDMLRMSLQELVPISLSLGIGILVTFRMYARLYSERTC